MHPYRELDEFKRCFHCSWAAYWMAANGTTLAIVAELPLHSDRKPSFLKVRTRNRIAPRNEYRLSLDTEMTGSLQIIIY